MAIHIPPPSRSNRDMESDDVYAESISGVAIIVLLIALMSLALGGVLVRVSEIGPIGTALYRVMLALPLLLAWMLREGDSTSLSKHAFGKPHLTAMLSGLFLAADLALWHMSFFMTTLANANLLANLMPFILVPLNIIIFRRFPRKRFISGVIIGAVGLAFLAGGKAEFKLSSLNGDLLALATAFFYAVYLLITGTLRQHYSATSIMFWSSLGCAISLLPIAIAFEGIIAPTTVSGWGVLVAVALVSQIMGQGFLAYAIGKVGVTMSSAIVLLQPVIAAVYAYLFFSESLTATELTGAAILLIGIFVAKRGTTSPKHGHQSLVPKKQSAQTTNKASQHVP